MTQRSYLSVLFDKAIVDALRNLGPFRLVFEDMNGIPFHEENVEHDVLTTDVGVALPSGETYKLVSPNGCRQIVLLGRDNDPIAFLPIDTNYPTMTIVMPKIPYRDSA